MTDDQLLRYSRHILLDDIGIEGQQRLRDARVLVIGAGGLGSPAAIYLAASGVGHITLVDDDVVDLTNLQRQILHGTPDVGNPKVASGAKALKRLNPDVVVEPLRERLDGTRLTLLVAAADVVLDCSDNFATRHAINRACVDGRVPLVSGAAIRFDGQIASFDLRASDDASPLAPCYACLFPESDEVDEVALLDDGRVRAVDGNRRRHAGGRSRQDDRRPAVVVGSPAAARCTNDGLADHRVAARSRLPGLRDGGRPPSDWRRDRSNASFG